MFNINQFNRKATGITPSAEVKSTTMNDILVAAESAGCNYPQFKIAETKYGRKLIFGTFDEKGFSVPGTDMLAFNVKIETTGENDTERLQELVQYPVYFGSSVHEETNELGEKVTRTTNWLTISKVGTLESKPATAFDLKALVTGKNITTAVA